MVVPGNGLDGGDRAQDRDAVEPPPVKTALIVHESYYPEVGVLLFIDGFGQFLASFPSADDDDMLFHLTGGLQVLVDFGDEEYAVDK